MISPFESCLKRHYLCRKCFLLVEVNMSLWWDREQWKIEEKSHDYCQDVSQIHDHSSYLSEHEYIACYKFHKILSWIFVLISWMIQTVLIESAGKLFTANRMSNSPLPWESKLFQALSIIAVQTPRPVRVKLFTAYSLRDICIGETSNLNGMMKIWERWKKFVVLMLISKTTIDETNWL